MIEESESTIGTRIAAYRRANGWSAQELADLCGGDITRSIITNIENGRRADITVSQLLTISSALGVPPVALVFDVRRPGRMYALRDLTEEEAAELPSRKSRDPRIKKFGKSRHAMSGWAAVDWFSGNNVGPVGMLTRAGQWSAHALRRLREYKRKSWQLDEVEVLLADAHVNDAPAEEIEKLERERKLLLNDLWNAGRDLTEQDIEVEFGKGRPLWDWDRAGRPRAKADPGFGLPDIPVDTQRRERWQVDHSVPQAVVDLVFAEVVGG